ncbi:MAG: hypothetical protein IJT18_05755 [Oscillospiraceae bacterium]|nr:hypothetical protein [Oscillospiraceae bacterium]
MKARKAAVILSFLLLFVMLFSLFFVIAEADHDCAHEDCPICRLLAVVEDTLKKALPALCAAAVAAAATLAAEALRGFFAKPVVSANPVLLKVKLSD